MRTVRLLISGRVQGVGYREWVRRQALALGIRGWVRNLRDGRVEASAAGKEDAVAAFIQAAKIGPPLARIDNVQILPGEEESAAGFEIRPTA